MLVVNLKAMTVVLAVALTVFVIAKPLCLRFMSESDFVRRRNVWIALTVMAFLSPSFWLFVLAAFPLLAWSAGKDSTPVALYAMMMYIIPPGIAVDIPMVGVNNLFDLDNYRILALAILLPSVWRIARAGADSGSTSKALLVMDAMLVAYAVLRFGLMLPYDSFTNGMRRGFLFFLDVLLVYYVTSRTCSNRRALADVMAAFCLVGAILAPLAVFEAVKAWELYREIGARWEVPAPLPYLFREELMRAQVSTGHALTLGYWMAIAFGFWLYLGSQTRSLKLTVAVSILLWMGLVATYSRAPWITAVILLFGYLFLGPNGTARFFKGAMLAAVLAAIVLISPMGDRVIASLPFIGTVDAETVSYRQQVAERSWAMIRQNPLFGSPFVIFQLEDLRQGQGIIDIMNQYAVVALYYGLVGLLLFSGTFLVGIWATWRLVRQNRKTNPDYALLGACLVACIVATMFFMTTSHMANGQLLYLLVGLLAAFVRSRNDEKAVQREPLTVTHPATPWVFRQ